MVLPKVAIMLPKVVLVSGEDVEKENEVEEDGEDEGEEIELAKIEIR